jgi:hypothetical protein
MFWVTKQERAINAVYAVGDSMVCISIKAQNYASLGAHS